MTYLIWGVLGAGLDVVGRGLMLWGGAMGGGVGQNPDIKQPKFL